jgi:hypothetical protein
MAQAERVAVVVPGHEALDVSVILADPYKDLALLKLELSNSRVYR